VPLVTACVQGEVDEQEQADGERIEREASHGSGIGWAGRGVKAKPGSGTVSGAGPEG